MLNLSEILISNKTGITPKANTIKQTPETKISWTHFKTKSKSHSPKNFYNFKPFKVPLSKAEILDNHFKRNFEKNCKKPTKLQNSPKKLSPLSTRHETEENPKNLEMSFSSKNVKKVKIAKNQVFFFQNLRKTTEKIDKTKVFNEFSQEASFFEEHPLFSEKFARKNIALFIESKRAIQRKSDKNL